MESEEYYKSLATIRMAAGAILRNEKSELLIVKPSYKDEWEIPGVCVEANESPLGACVREIQEELGLTLEFLNLLCVDYTKSEDLRTDSLQFLFTGPRLTDEKIQLIKLAEDELTEYRFVDLATAVRLLGPRIRERVEHCFPQIDEGSTFYLENGADPEKITS